MNNQSIYEVFEHQKTELLIHLINSLPEAENVMVFLRAREGVHAVTTALNLEEMSVDSIHGKMKVEAREEVFKEFKAGSHKILVVTEAAIRGENLDGVTNVIHYDFAELEADYLQRVKCVSDAGGVVITLEIPKDKNLVSKLEKWAGVEIEKVVDESFSYAKQPISMKLANRVSKKKSTTDRSKPLQNKKQKWRPKKYGRS